jgi:hypothetical protein
MDLSDAQAKRVEALTRSIVNKILHRPLARLGAQTEEDQGLAVVEEARALFGLDDSDAPGAEVDSELGASELEPVPPKTLKDDDVDEVGSAR